MFRFCLLFLFLSFFLGVSASEGEGYIIKMTGDTVRGKVEVAMSRSGFGKKRLDLGEMEQVIEFTDANGKSYKFRAGEIAGFGFNYNDLWYHFVVLDMRTNVWKKERDETGRRYKDLVVFLYRASDGAVPVYKDYYKYEQKTTSFGGGGSRTTTTVNTKETIYIKSADMGFIEVAPPNFSSNRKLKEFLIKYLNLEEDFLKMVSDKANFNDAEEVINSYNQWKQQNR